MRVHRELIDRFGGLTLGADDPSLLARWTAGRSTEEAVFATIDGLAANLRDDAYRMLVDASTRIILACSCDHPCLVQFVEWVGGRDDVLFVASPTGPPPPAVFILEKDPGS